MAKRTFDRDFMLDLLGSKAVISDKITDHSRWSVGHELIFSHEDKTYRTHYSVGATESQEEGPWDDEDEGVECCEVQPVEKTVTVYEAVE